MPTLLVAEGYRFFFFSNEGQESPHVHVRRGGGLAKVWLEPIGFAYASNLNPAELRRVRELAAEHRATFLERWHEHLGR
ncbi:MAG TPA: DUF4160 domain-containing protein [Chloroflexota bacterium]|nr:DUF4160 domain-containing protein [Chloroflexota bacterium]